MELINLRNGWNVSSYIDGKKNLCAIPGRRISALADLALQLLVLQPHLFQVGRQLAQFGGRVLALARLHLLLEVLDVAHQSARLLHQPQDLAAVAVQRRQRLVDATHGVVSFGRLSRPRRRKITQ